MESTAALLNGLAALPQIVQSAKDLYDLRSRYKDASVLITAIYSESMVIAASLSQIQNLLQHDAIRSKPQLLHTFDQALTGCRVVYVCLAEEVQDLAEKAKSDNMKFKDRARFVWKEDTFKELLVQIRGQQSALNLLIQGLQMESIADIKKLVEENSIALDQVVKRSKTLRQAHPRVKVPESIFDQKGRVADEADIDPVVDSAEFAFDDEIVNSKAYRRAMAAALANSDREVKTPNIVENELLEDDKTISEPPLKIIKGIDGPNSAKLSAAPAMDDGDGNIETKAKQDTLPQTPVKEEHQDLFDTLERDILAYMPRITSTAPHLSSAAIRSDTLNALPIRDVNALAPAPLRSCSEGSQITAWDAPPPLPPRRPSEQHMLPKTPSTITPKPRSASSDDSQYTSDAPSVLSEVSTASSYTLCEVSQSSSNLLETPSRKPISLSSRSSYNASSNVQIGSPETNSTNTSSPLQNKEMHDIWMSLLDAERKFVDRMIKLRRMLYDNTVRQWPVLEKHLDAILVGEKLANAHQQCLVQPMDKQLSGASDLLCDPYVFENWISRSQQLHREYGRKMPHASSSLRTTQHADPKFSPFINTLGLSIVYFGKGWEDYMELPTLQLQSYVDRLQSLVDIADTLNGPAGRQEMKRLTHVLKAVTGLKTSTSVLVEHAQAREDIQILEKRIRTDAETLFQLQLQESARRVKYQGSMALKFKNQGPWIPIHAILMDNFLVWGKSKKSAGSEILILNPPIAVGDLELELPAVSNQSQKATVLDQIPRGTTLYIITIKDKTLDRKPSLLGLYSSQERQTWYDHLVAAISSLQK